MDEIRVTHYDFRGNPIWSSRDAGADKVIDSIGETRWDAIGNMLHGQVRKPDNETPYWSTDYSYDKESLIIMAQTVSTVDVSSHTVFSYDDARHLVLVTVDELGETGIDKTTRYKYDVSGNVIEERGHQADIPDDWIYRQWWADGLLITRTLDAHADGTADRSYIHHYNGQRQLIRIDIIGRFQQRTNWDDIYYDDRGLRVREESWAERNNGPEHEGTTTMKYDRVGRQIEQVSTYEGATDSTYYDFKNCAYSK